MTGIASGKVDKLNLSEAVDLAKDTNIQIAKIIDINPAARISTIKPSGTTSLVLGTSSGIHAWHSPYYIRRIQLPKDNSLYNYLKENHPELVKESKTFNDAGIFEVPIQVQTEPL